MLELEVTTLDGVAENLRDLYAEKDGKYTLQVKGAVSQSVFEQRGEQLQEARAESIDRRKMLDLYKPFGTVEEIQAKLSAAAKGKNPEAETIIAELRKAADAEKAALQSRIDGMVKKTTAAALKAELAQAGVVPEGLDLLATFAGQRIQYDGDAARFLTADGKPMIGSGADGAATMAEFVAKLTEGYPSLVKAPGAGGAGTQPNAKGGTPAGKTVKRSEFDAMSQPARADFAKSGGSVVD